MSGGTFNQGSAAKIKIGTADPPTIELEGVKSATLTKQRATSEDDFYMEASDTSIGKASRRWNIQGRCKSGAPGLILADASFEDDTGPIIWISGSLEGTKGQSLQVRISNVEVGFPDANQKCTYTIQAEQAGDPTDLAGGAIFT